MNLIGEDEEQLALFKIEESGGSVLECEGWNGSCVAPSQVLPEACITPCSQDERTPKEGPSNRYSTNEWLQG